MSRTAELASKQSLIEGLIALEARIAGKAAACKVHFRRSPADLPRRLALLEGAALDHLLVNLGDFERSIDLAASAGVDLWDDVEFFRLSMSALGLSFPSDFIGKLGPEDVIEAYDLQRRQIFRNMRFMEMSSYSLLEMLSSDWTQLFERSGQITELLIQWSEKILWTENKTLELDIPKHVIRELRSCEPQACEVRQKYFAPLFSGPNKPGGALSVCEARVLAAKLDIARDNVTFV